MRLALLTWSAAALVASPLAAAARSATGGLAGLLGPSAARSVACQEPDAPSDEELSTMATAMLKTVGDLCGSPFGEPVPVAVQSTEQVRSYMTGKVDHELRDGRLERLDAWLHCLGLLEPGQTFREEIGNLMTEQAAGYYDAEHKVMHLQRGAGVYGLWYARYTTAHELAHAWDDQQVDLHRLAQPAGRDLSKDATLAIGAVVEGSALSVADRWAAGNPPTSDDRPMQSPAARAALARSQAALARAPRYCALQVGKHAIGRAFFAAGRSARGLEPGAPLGLPAIAADLPRSTEQMLHPERYWAPARRDPPVELQDLDQLAAAIAAASGSRVLEQNTLGEMIAAVVAAGRSDARGAPTQRDPAAWTNAAATGWGGDRLFLLGTAGGAAGAPVAAPGVVWITAWDSVADREEFAAAVSDRRADLLTAAVSQGRVAAFAFGETGDLDEAALRALLGSCRFRHGDDEWRP